MGLKQQNCCLKNNKDLKIIAITAHEERLYIDDIANTGFIAFIYKNQVFDQLENAIESAIKGKLIITI